MSVLLLLSSPCNPKVGDEDEEVVISVFAKTGLLAITIVVEALGGIRVPRLQVMLSVNPLQESTQCLSFKASWVNKVMSVFGQDFSSLKNE